MARTVCFALIVVAFVAPSLLRAQPLADRVPEGALLYVGWAGAEEMDGFEGSKLAAVIESAKLADTFGDALPAWLEGAAARGSADPRAAEFYRTLGAVLWKRPWAMYLSRFEQPANGGPPRPVFGWVIDAGDHADVVRRESLRAVEEAKKTDPNSPRRLIENGNIFTLTDAEVEVGGGVAAGDAFEAARGQVAVEPSVMLYVDLAGIVDEVDILINEGGSDEDLDRWNRLGDELGLRNLKQVVYAGGFTGTDWQTEAHIGATDIRNTLLRVMAGEPVTDAELALAPRNATWVSAQRFDAGVLMDTIRGIARAMGDQPAAGFERALGEARRNLGIDLEADLVRALGSAWVVYHERGIAGPMGLGFVAVNPLKDAGKAEASLAAVENKLNAMLEAEPPESRVPFRFKTVQQGETTIHSFAAPMVSPSWAVKDGRLYVSLFPQAIATADLYAKQAGNTILQNEGFQAMRARLGQQAATGVMFADLPQTAPTIYPNYLMLAQMASAAAPDAPPGAAMMLPPLDKILPHLAPAGSVAWTDDAGWHHRAISPFPGGTLLSHQAAFSGGPGAWFLGAGVALPSLVRAREVARDTQALSNLRQIGMAVHMYANDHKGELPPSFAELVPYLGGNLRLFASPRSRDAVPDPAAMEPAALRDWFTTASALVYVRPADKLSQVRNAAETVLAFERPWNAGDGTLALVFLDGHAETLPLAEATRRIETQTGKTLEQLAGVEGGGPAGQ